MDAKTVDMLCEKACQDAEDHNLHSVRDMSTAKSAIRDFAEDIKRYLADHPD